MTEPPSTTFNNSDQVHVGVQANTIHGDVNYYTLPPNPTADEKFVIGVRHLDGRMAATARRYIHEAVAEGYKTNQSCFYWLLAMFSNRTLRQLTDDERASLKDTSNVLRIDGSDEWAEGVRVISSLLESLEQPDAQASSEAFARLDRLPDPQRSKIITHLELLLKGKTEDHMWSLSVSQAEGRRMANDRGGRVWKFFEPDPARPRVRHPEIVLVRASTWIWLWTVTTLAFLAAWYLAVLLVVHGDAVEFLIILTAVAGACYMAHFGLEWRFRARRLEAKNKEYYPSTSRVTIAPAGGFTSQVHRAFDHYFALYLPGGIDRETWLNETAGIRRSLCDEMLEIYRESDVTAKEVAWLIRFQVSQVRKAWSAGTLLTYQEDLRTPLLTKCLTLLGTAVFVISGSRVIVDALRFDAVRGVTSTVVLLVAGKLTADGWSRIVLARRSFAMDEAESQQRLAASRVGYDRWVAKLRDKPTDTEMATWLDDDRKVLMKRALERYKLRASGIIAHAFIEAPRPHCDRARVKNGPWRYSAYTLLVFVLTSDGVRQISVDLDFAKGAFKKEARINYRFDAVASVEVTEGEKEARTFELALLNNSSIKIQVTEPGMRTLPEETASAVSEVTLDSAGLNNTLHVLEGIAAEGKSWVEREDERSGDLTWSVLAALHDLVDQPATSFTASA